MPRWFAVAVVLLAGILALPAAAQGLPGWKQSGPTVTLAASGTSSRVQLGWATATPGGTGPPVTNVCNMGAADAFVALGDVTVVATTSSVYVAQTHCIALDNAGQTYIAAITASGTTTLYAMSGSGTPLLAKGSAGKPPGFLPAGVGFYANFANGKVWQGATCKTVPTCITTTRASVGMAVNSSGNWTQFAANQPRVTNLGLTVEESRTNLVIQSNDLSNAASWSLLNAAVVSGQPSPDGGNNAQKLQDSNTVTGGHNVTANVNAGTFTAGSTITYSGSFKPAEYTQVGISVFDPTFANQFLAVFDIPTGNLIFSNAGGAGTFISASAVVYPNGWTRVSATGKVDNVSTAARVQIVLNASGSYTGVPGNGTYVWQSQLEVGAFGTTPIPTTSAAVTRQADNITLTTLPTMGSGYTVLGSGAPGAPVSNATAQLVFELDDTTANNRTTAYRSGNATPFIVAGGTTIYSPTLATWPQNTLGKIAVAYRSGAQASAFNGVADNTGVSAAAMATPTRLVVGAALANFFWNGTISQVALWPTTALTAAQLQAITM